MARLAECSPSSDDELPDLKTLILEKGTGSTRTAAKPVIKATVKTLAPKSTPQTSTRRVPRLAKPDQTTENPLFRRWNSEDHESCRSSLGVKGKEPRVRAKEVRERAPTVVSSSQVKPLEEDDEDDDDEEEDKDIVPQRRLRGTQRRRPNVVEDSDESSDEASDSDSDKEEIFTRIRRLQSAKKATTAPATSRTGPLIGQRNRTQDVGRPKEGSPETVRRVKDLQEATVTRPKHNEADDDEPSVYQTAEEQSPDSSADSASEFEPDRSPDGSKQSPARLLFRAPGKPVQRSDSASPIKNPPPLRPRDRNLASKTTAILDNDNDSQGGNMRAEPRARIRKSSATDGDDVAAVGPEAKPTVRDLADTLSKLRLQLEEFSEEEKVFKDDRFVTPPGTPPKTSKPGGLASPTKRIQIPQTPHRPSMDAFWDQDVVDDWNDQYSPRKLILPPVTQSPAKKSPQKETKKSFTARKHALADDFLRELDAKITHGRIAELAEPTGGVKIVWTKTLNTTAGRARWRRETVWTKGSDGKQKSVTYKHHAAIELAEKVIDDEHRLLNVVAHEFCHLANFMVSGITDQPHGKDFKAWGARCSLAFGDRGIEVTTKHSYDIDFKYVWECSACGTEFKRHSKSIDPARHRCGSCKSELKQTKPPPRGGGGKPSRYQVFVKEQMAVVRQENPGSPQKDVMKLIAAKWAKQGGGGGGDEAKKGVDEIIKETVDLTLED